MRRILKVGYEGRVIIPKKDRIAMNLEQGSFVSVDIENVKIERVSGEKERKDE